MRDLSQQFVIQPTIKNSVFIVLFAMVFFLLGVLGLEVQSEYKAVSPFWPASGLTFALFFIVGFRLWPGVIIAMIFLGLYAKVPLTVAVLTGILTVLESAIPLLIAKRYKFNGRLDSFHDGLIFSAIVVCAPIITALFGTNLMYIFSGGQSLPSLDLMMIWWLGNSLGILLLGGALLSIYSASRTTTIGFRLNEKTAFVLSVVFVFLLAFTQSMPLQAALMINLLIPIVFLSALRFGSCGPTVLSLLFVVLMSFYMAYHESVHDEKIHAEFQYLILVKIWFVCLSGVLISGAFKDKNIQGKLQWLALHDDLTGLSNRVSIEEEIEQSLKGIRSSDSNVCLLFLDIDHFKPINDQLGHKKGDEVLNQVAQVLLSSVRHDDIVSRWGGDEFVILLQQCSAEQAKEIANKILEGVTTISFVENNIDYPVSMSIGIASAILGETMLTFVERADAACYSAKYNGKNQSVIA